jgi:hypothetical protein
MGSADKLRKEKVRRRPAYRKSKIKVELVRPAATVAHTNAVVLTGRPRFWEGWHNNRRRACGLILRWSTPTLVFRSLNPASRALVARFTNFFSF